MALERLGCHFINAVINAKSYSIYIDGALVPAFTCNCGSYKIASARVAESLMDKMNELQLVELPIFEDPINLSLELSIAIFVIVGKLGSVLANFLYLPSIIGYLLSGVAIQVFFIYMFVCYVNICIADNPKLAQSPTLTVNFICRMLLPRDWSRVAGRAVRSLFPKLECFA